MKTTRTLRQRGTRRPATGRERSGDRVEKPHHIDVVWILLWILLVIGLLLTVGVFYAVMTPASGM